MKKLLLTTLVSSIFLFSEAQITKGSLLIGGNVGLNYHRSKNTTTDPSKSTGFYFSPSVGYAFRENTIAGIGLGYGQNSNRNNNYKTESSGFSADFFYRKYRPLGKGFYLFGEAGLFADRNIQEQFILDELSQSDKQTAVGFYLYPGVSYAVSKKFHLELSLNRLLELSYRKYKTEFSTNPSSGGESDSFALATSLSSSSPVNVGFRFLFSK